MNIDLIEDFRNTQDKPTFGYVAKNALKFLDDLTGSFCTKRFVRNWLGKEEKSRRRKGLARSRL